MLVLVWSMHSTATQGAPRLALASLFANSSRLEKKSVQNHREVNRDLRANDAFLSSRVGIHEIPTVEKMTNADCDGLGSLSPRW